VRPSAVVVALLALLASAWAADWPQFMRTADHAGDAADEALQLPLGLVAQVRLDDAIMASPAVVSGLAYVVDQMGAAYCVDPRAGRILWKAAPDAERAKGSNTSSPCVVGGRMCFGTTAGMLHFLNAADGRVVKSADVGAPVVSAVTSANGRVYLQVLDAVVRCFDADGNELWAWDHYKRYSEPPEVTKAEAPRRGHPGSYERPHYGGGDVAVSGSRVVTSMGWDLLCLEDRGGEAALAWCRRCPAGRDGPMPMSSSICGGHVYTAGMGADGCLGLMRFALQDGASARDGGLGIPFPWSTAASRGTSVVTRRESWRNDIICLYDWEGKKTTELWHNQAAATPLVSSPCLTREHCVIASLSGELIVAELAPKPAAKPFIFRTPSGKGIGSSPIVSGGCVYFGCDDGYLYVLGPGGTLEPTRDAKPSLHERRGRPQSPTGRSYGWPCVNGNQANTGFTDDPALKPPLGLAWAARGFGHFKTPCIATEEGDVFTVTLDRTVSCLEQATGRLRWRLRLPPDSSGHWSSACPLAADGRLYVPCPNRPRGGGKLLCLDVRDGRILWSAETGEKFIWNRASPLLAAGNVVYSYQKKGTPPTSLIAAWDAATGTPAWQVELNVTSGVGATAAGCRAPGAGDGSGDTVYFTCGTEAWGWKPEGDRKRGETIAIDAKTGTILWRTHEFFGSNYGTQPVLVADKLFMCELHNKLYCLSATDGKLLWKASGGNSHMSAGPDFLVSRGYAGAASRNSLADGSPSRGLVKGGQLGGDAHACGPVALTSGGLALAVTVAGFHVRDSATGELLWLSPGFAPRSCLNPAVANGRVFFNSSANGMVYCWEPAR